MIVMKFGGSSVGSVDAIRQVADIVERYRDRQPVVVVSAMRGVTDLLLELHQELAEGENSATEGMFERLHSLHRNTLLELLGERQDPQLQAQLEVLLRELTEQISLPVVNEEGRPRMTDQIVSFGERLSAVLVTAALRVKDLPALPFDARGFIFTDNRYGSANVDFVRTYLAANSVLHYYVEGGGVPVVTGFIGSASDGTTTTLGRGGSDYTATLLGAALKVDEVWFWKEVDGVLSADPVVVPDATCQAEVTYDEAAELSYFGAKVLHPRTMNPVSDRDIPIRIRNTFAPDAPGTVIGSFAEEPTEGVRGITRTRDMALLKIKGRGMRGVVGLARRVFESAEKAGVNVLMFGQASSEQNICLVCEQSDGQRLESALKEGLREHISTRTIDKIESRTDVVAVSIVGEGMEGRVGVAGKVFTAVAGAGVSLLAIVQAAECNISFVVEQGDVDQAVRAVHAAFCLGRQLSDDEVDDEQ